MSRLSQSSLVDRLRITLVVAGVLLLAVVGAALAVLTGVRSSQDRVVDDYFRAIQISTTQFQAVNDIQSAVREYALTGDPAGQAQVRQLLTPRPGAPTGDDLRAALAGDRRSLAALDTAGTTARAWLATVQATLSAVAAGGPTAVSAGDLAAQRAAYEAVRQDYERYLGVLLDARSEARAALDLRTSLLFGAVILASLVALGAGVVLYTALRRWVVRPLADLSAETRQVRQGDVGHTVTVDGPPEIVALGEDVEAMRRRLVDQLEQVESTGRHVEQARALLEAQAEDLRRSNRDLEQFAYVASHDLQEPLRKVASFCQLLERRYKGQLDERADQYIAFAVDGSKRMQLLINDLLAFSRVGRLSQGMQPVALDEVLALAERNLSSALEESRATVESDPLPTVVGERSLLVQLLQNLIGNAVKFRGEDPPVVRLTVERKGAMWEFAVSDNGIGIEPQYAERIFVIFQRLHPKEEYEGTGIGLALCKKIVEYHGGDIWLDSPSGTGTTFRWTLPVQGAPRADQSAVPVLEGTSWTS